MNLQRKKKSGYEYRKLKEEKKIKEDTFMAKVPSLKCFFQKNDSEPSTSAISNQKEEVKEVENEQNVQKKIKEKEIQEASQCAENVHLEDNKNVNQNTIDFDYYNDPAKWNDLNDTKISQIIMNVNKSEIDIDKLDFTASKISYKSQNRFANSAMFYRILLNGKKQKRNWLLYSNSTGKLFCIPCKLFGKISGNFSVGFNDWKHAEQITVHENSTLHKESTRIYVNRLNSKQEYFQNYSLIEMTKNINYWKNILLRIIKVIKFLSSRGLAFRGKNQIVGNKSNGNYLGCIELLAKFDPLLQKHLCDFANKGIGNVSYLSANICDEFISILGDNVKNCIVSELKEAKYFSLIIDSTPDISHSDQLTIVIRYVNTAGTAVERFLYFVENVGHKNEEMENCIMENLINLNLNLEDCRGQSYDNASNMSGVYNGLQARIKLKNNLAMYVPCAAHSLNLIGESAAEFCLEATKLFMFIQNLYNFFAASTGRWEILKSHLSLKCKVPKTLSNTRWSANAEAVNAVATGYRYFKNALKDISDNSTQKPCAKLEAKNLEKQLNLLETALMIIFWNDILQTMNKINTSLQKVEIDIETVVSLYSSLEEYIQEKRNVNSFKYYKIKAVELSGCDEYKITRNIKKKKQVDENKSSDTTFDKDEDFRINTYYIIIDKLQIEIRKRKLAYGKIFSIFGVLINLKKLDDDTIRKRATILYNTYPDYLEENFIEECLHFKHVNILPDDNVSSKSELSLKTIINSNIESTFPNVATALRIFISIACTNCSGERSFSVLKRIKNYLRSSLGQCKLNNLSILTIESDILESIDLNSIINKFAEKKSRKKFVR